MWTEIAALEEMHDHWLPPGSLVQQVCQQQLKNDKSILLRKSPQEIVIRLKSMQTALIPTDIDELAPLPYEIDHGRKVSRSSRSGLLALQQLHQSRRRLHGYYYSASVRYESMNPQFARLLSNRARHMEMDSTILQLQIQANPKSRRYLVCDPRHILVAEQSVNCYLN